MESDESIWLVKAKQGDKKAFSMLISHYQIPVFNLCYRMLGNRNDAEDAAQETFLRVFKSIDRYDINRKFSTWILSVASHYCIDRLRKRRLQTFSIDDDEKNWFHPPDPGLNPEESLLDKQKAGQIANLLSSLRPKDRATVILRYWYDYSYEEIARSLSLTTGAVKSRLHRAKKSLAGTWEENHKTHNIDDSINTERLKYESQSL